MFLLVVVLPTALASIYFGLIASDRFVAESAFVVRSAKQPLGGGLGSLLQMTGIAAPRMTPIRCRNISSPATPWRRCRSG